MCDGTGLQNGASLPPFAHWWSPKLGAIPIFQTVSPRLSDNSGEASLWTPKRGRNALRSAVSPPFVPPIVGAHGCPNDLSDSFWKARSRKFVSRILHRPVPEARGWRERPSSCVAKQVTRPIRNREVRARGRG